MWQWSFPSKQEVYEYRSTFRSEQPIRNNKEERETYIEEELLAMHEENNKTEYDKARIVLLANYL